MTSEQQTGKSRGIMNVDLVPTAFRHVSVSNVRTAGFFCRIILCSSAWYNTIDVLDVKLLLHKENKKSIIDILFCEENIMQSDKKKS